MAAHYLYCSRPKNLDEPLSQRESERERGGSMLRTDQTGTRPVIRAMYFGTDELHLNS